MGLEGAWRRKGEEKDKRAEPHALKTNEAARPLPENGRLRQRIRLNAKGTNRPLPSLLVAWSPHTIPAGFSQPPWDERVDFHVTRASSGAVARVALALSPHVAFDGSSARVGEMGQLNNVGLARPMRRALRAGHGGAA